MHWIGDRGDPLNGWPRMLVYGGAALAVGVALLLTLLLSPLHSTPPVLFVAVIAGVAWLGGRGPAFLAIILAMLAQDYFIIQPRWSVLSSIDDVVRFLAFLFVAFT